MEEGEGMTPAEKWQRLTHPTCVEDYGIGISFKELEEIPEAMAEVLSYLPPNWQAILTEETQPNE